MDQQPPKFSIKRVGEDLPEQEQPPEEVEVTPDSIKENTLKNASIQEAENKVPCINCETLLEEGTILCIDCGTNQISGKGTKTKSKKAKKKKVKIVSSSKRGPLGAWSLTFAIFIIVGGPVIGLRFYISNALNDPVNQIEQCKKTLSMHNISGLGASSYYCDADSANNYDFYTTKSKEVASSPNFVKVHCKFHKQGLNLRDQVVKVDKPVGQKKKIPKKFLRSKTIDENMSFGLNMLFWGILLNVVSKLSFFIYALRDGIATVLCCLFIPFYSLVFLLRNMDETMPSLIVGISSGIMIVLGAWALIPTVI